jgi:hypothetical protein
MDSTGASSSSGDQSTHLEGVSSSLSLSTNRLLLRQLQSTTRIDAGQEDCPHDPKRDAGDWKDRYQEQLRSIGAASANRPPTRRGVNDPTSTSDTPVSRPSTAHAADKPPAAEDTPAARSPTPQAIDDHTTTGDTPTTRSPTAQATDAPTTTGDATANQTPAPHTGYGNEHTATEAVPAAPFPPNPLPPTAPQANPTLVTPGPAIRTPANQETANQETSKGNPMKIFHH